MEPRKRQEAPTNVNGISDPGHWAPVAPGKVTLGVFHLIEDTDAEFTVKSYRWHKAEPGCEFTSAHLKTRILTNRHSHRPESSL